MIKTTRRTIAAALCLGMVSVMGLSACSNVSYDAQAATSKTHLDQAYFVDILYLQDGKTAADAAVYFAKVEPVIAKHGLNRIAPGFVITKKMAGSIDPDLINIWTVSDTANTFNDIFGDENYLRNIPLRDATFNMSKSHMFMMKSLN